MNIGHITLKGKHYEGILRTLTLNAEFTLEPIENRKEKSPDFRLFVHGTQDAGYAYRESFDSESEGRTIHYLSIKIDDPAFNYPIYAKAYLSEKDELPLVWSRPKPKAKA